MKKQEKILQAMKTLKENCLARKSCMGCQLRLAKDDYSMSCQASLPSTWKIPEINNDKEGENNDNN